MIQDNAQERTPHIGAVPSDKEAGGQQLLSAEIQSLDQNQANNNLAPRCLLPLRWFVFPTGSLRRRLFRLEIRCVIKQYNAAQGADTGLLKELLALRTNQWH